MADPGMNGYEEVFANSLAITFDKLLAVWNANPTAFTSASIIFQNGGVPILSLQNGDITKKVLRTGQNNAVWEFIEGTDIKSTQEQGSLVLTSNGSGGAYWAVGGGGGSITPQQLQIIWNQAFQQSYFMNVNTLQPSSTLGDILQTSYLGNTIWNSFANVWNQQSSLAVNKLLQGTANQVLTTIGNTIIWNDIPALTVDQLQSTWNSSPNNSLTSLKLVYDVGSIGLNVLSTTGATYMGQLLMYNGQSAWGIGNIQISLNNLTTNGAFLQKISPDNYAFNDITNNSISAQGGTQGQLITNNSSSVLWSNLSWEQLFIAWGASSNQTLTANKLLWTNVTNQIPAVAITVGLDSQLLYTTSAGVTTWTYLNTVWNNYNNNTFAVSKIAAGTPNQILATVSGVSTWAGIGTVITDSSISLAKLITGSLNQMVVTDGITTQWGNLPYSQLASAWFASIDSTLSISKISYEANVIPVNALQVILGNKILCAIQGQVQWYELVDFWNSYAVNSFNSAQISAIDPLKIMPGTHDYLLASRFGESIWYSLIDLWTAQTGQPFVVGKLANGLPNQIISTQGGITTWIDLNNVWNQTNNNVFAVSKLEASVTNNYVLTSSGGTAVWAATGALTREQLQSLWNSCHVNNVHMNVEGLLAPVDNYNVLASWGGVSWWYSIMDIWNENIFPVIRLQTTTGTTNQILTINQAGNAAWIDNAAILTPAILQSQWNTSSINSFSVDKLLSGTTNYVIASAPLGPSWVDVKTLLSNLDPNVLYPGADKYILATVGTTPQWYNFVNIWNAYVNNTFDSLKLLWTANSVPVNVLVSGAANKLIITDGTTISWGNLSSDQLAIAWTNTSSGTLSGANITWNSLMASAINVSGGTANQLLQQNGYQSSWGDLSTSQLLTAWNNTGSGTFSNAKISFISSNIYVGTLVSGTAGQLISTNGVTTSWSNLSAAQLLTAWTTTASGALSGIKITNNTIDVAAVVASATNYNILTSFGNVSLWYTLVQLWNGSPVTFPVNHLETLGATENQVLTVNSIGVAVWANSQGSALTPAALQTTWNSCYTQVPSITMDVIGLKPSTVALNILVTNSATPKITAWYSLYDVWSSLPYNTLPVTQLIAGTTNQVLTTNASGNTVWAAASITPETLLTAWNNSSLNNYSGTKLIDGSCNISKLLPGNNNYFLMTSSVGAVTWYNFTNFWNTNTFDVSRLQPSVTPNQVLTTQNGVAVWADSQGGSLTPTQLLTTWNQCVDNNFPISKLQTTGAIAASCILNQGGVATWTPIGTAIALQADYPNVTNSCKLAKFMNQTNGGCYSKWDSTDGTSGILFRNELYTDHLTQIVMKNTYYPSLTFYNSISPSNTDIIYFQRNGVSSAIIAYNGQYYQTSDAKIKRNIRMKNWENPSKNYLARINDLKICSYTLEMPGVLHDTKLHVGVVAQQVESLFNGNCMEIKKNIDGFVEEPKKDDLLRINYSELFCYSVLAIQELTSMVKSLQHQVSELIEQILPQKKIKLI